MAPERETEVDDKDLIAYIGSRVSVAGRKEHPFLEGEMSYWAPHFQVYDKNKERHNLQDGDVINVKNGKSVSYLRYFPKPQTL